MSSDDALAPLLAMLRLLPTEAIEEVGRALHARLNAPPTAAERRVRDLAYLAELLDERPQFPDRPAYIPRKLYDERRAAEKPEAPPSARLQQRFGSWERACKAAWGLKPDGRSIGDGYPWTSFGGGRMFTEEEARVSVRQFASKFGRAPSSTEYHQWVIACRARARSEGTDIRQFVNINAVYRLLAPDRRKRNGWRLVLARVFENEPIDRPARATKQAQQRHGCGK
jgi:hypothetical protein